MRRPTGASSAIRSIDALFGAVPFQQLQATVGNSAIADFLSRRPYMPVVQRQADPPPAVSPQDRERQLYAATTMRTVPALDPAARARLDKAVSFAPVYKTIEERNATRAELKARQDELDAANNELSIATKSARDVSGAPGGSGPGSGEPEKAEQRLESARANVARLSRVVEAIGKELKGLDANVKMQLAELGVKDEDELVTFVNETFPKTFIDRGKQIAYAQLDANKNAAEKERERYNKQQGGGNDRQGLRTAANDLDNRTKAIAGLSRPELPEGGADEAAGRELNNFLARQESMQGELDKKTAEYKLKYPILFKIDPQRIAEASDKDLDALLDGPVVTVLDNIKTTKENIASEALKIWKLTAKGANIAQLTKDDLGIMSGSTLEQVIDRKAADDKTTGQVITEALTALSMVADTIALLTGPVGVAVAGGITAVAAVARVVEDYQTYRALEAAGGVAIPPDAAKMAQGEPDLEGLIFSLATAGIAALATAGAIRRVVETYKEARAAADLAAGQKLIDASVSDAAVKKKLIDKLINDFGAPGLPFGNYQATSNAKRLLIERWSQGGRYRLVKVVGVSSSGPDDILTAAGGYIGEERYIRGKTPEEMARILGVNERFFEKGARVYHFERVPTEAEIELRGYTHTPQGLPTNQYKPHPDYGPGSGAPQWRLNTRIPLAGSPVSVHSGMRYGGSS